MKKRILNLFLVVALGTTITVHASDVNTESVNLPQSTEEIQNEDADNINNASQSAYGVGSESGASAQVYVTQDDGFTTVYTPLEVRNGCSMELKTSSSSLNSYTFSKTEKNAEIKFDLYSCKDPYNIKEICIVAKLNEIPSSVSDGTVIAKTTYCEKYLNTLNSIYVYGYNTDTLKSLPNGTYYLRVFFKDVNNVYSVNGGMFSGNVSTINPKFIIKD